MSELFGIVFGRTLTTLGLLIVVGLSCGCQPPSVNMVNGDPDQWSEADIRSWADWQRKMSDDATKKAVRLRGEIAVLEDKLAEAKRRFPDIKADWERERAGIGVPPGPKPATPRAAFQQKIALGEERRVLYKAYKSREGQAKQDMEKICNSIDETKRKLKRTEDWIWTPAEIALKTKRYRSHQIALRHQGDWQLEQPIEKVFLLDVKLEKALEQISGDFGNFLVNWGALKAAGVRVITPVTYYRTNVRYGEALRDVLEQACGAHKAIVIGWVGNTVIVSTQKSLDDSAMLYKRTELQLAASGNKNDRRVMNMMVTQFDFEDMELGQIFEFLEDVVELKMQIDWDALKQYDITAETEVTIHTGRIKFGLFLRLMLDQAASGKVLLGVKVRDGKIIINPEDTSPAPLAVPGPKA
jgi:hypothetical protein